MRFENEHTIRKVILSKREREFHYKYEKAIESVKSQFGRKYFMIIDGKKVKSTNFVHTSPIDTRIVLGHFPLGTAKHVEAAVEAAKMAFPKWAKTDYKYRIKVCRSAADIIASRKFELAAWVSYENGKNRYEAIADVDEAIDFIRYYSNEMERNNGFIVQTRDDADRNEKNKSQMKPYGVWGIITPFNFPAAIMVGMSIAALLTGNTVVLKPASDTPVIGYLFTEIMKMAGLPNGVLNFVTGFGETIGNALLENKDVDGIAFTGSKQVGYKMMKKSNKVKYRPFIAEMGGKNPVIVTKNADIHKAVDGVLNAAFGFSGQKCSACSRIYVQKDIKDAFMKRLVQTTKNLTVGNPLERGVFMGPLINSKAYSNYQRYVIKALKDGKVGGAIKNTGDFKYGYYIEPTIVDGLPKSHSLFRDELFVPILCVAEYDSFKEAVNLCNDSDYGLTAGIYSNKKQEIDSFLNEIKAGVIYINRDTSATTGAMVGSQPFVGWRSSGTTGKGAGGPYYLTQFMHEQSQTIVE
jgi:1-pyrroline-5-carboxylate dehydrogenase